MPDIVEGKARTLSDVTVTTTILVIEDDINLCETLQLYIARERWRCLLAHSAEAGLLQARSCRFY